MGSDTGPRPDTALLRMVGWGLALSVLVSAWILLSDPLRYGTQHYEEPWSFVGRNRTRTYQVFGFVALASTLWALACDFLAGAVRKSGASSDHFVLLRLSWIVGFVWLVVLMNLAVVVAAGAGEGEGLDGAAQARVGFVFVILMILAGIKIGGHVVAKNDAREAERSAD